MHQSEASMSTAVCLFKKILVATVYWVAGLYLPPGTIGLDATIVVTMKNRPVMETVTATVLAMALVMGWVKVSVETRQEDVSCHTRELSPSPLHFWEYQQPESRQPVQDKGHTVGGS